MKLTTKKKLSFFAACLVVLFCMLSFLGIHSRWGYTIINHIKGWQNLRFGLDFDKHTELTLKPEKEDIDLEDEDILNSIQNRLNFLGFHDNRIYVDKNNKLLTIKFSQPAGKQDFDSQTLVNLVGFSGEFTITDSKKDDAYVKPDSPDENAINNYDIDRVYLTTQKNEWDMSKLSDPEFGLIIKLNETGTAKLANLTTNLLAANSNEQNPSSKKDNSISVILNSMPIYSTKISTPITDGTIKIFNGSCLELLNQQLAILKNPPLPSAFHLESLRKVSPELGLFFKRASFFALVVALIAVALILIVNFKVVGLVCSICLAGHVSFILACFTGFFKIYPGVIFNFAAFVASVVSIIVGVISCFIISSKIYQNSKKENCPFSLAIKNGFASSLKLVSSINLKTMVGSIVLMAIFSCKTNLIMFILSPLYDLCDVQMQFNAALSSIAYALFVGSLGALIFEVIIIKYILNPVTSPNFNFKKMFSVLKFEFKSKSKNTKQPKVKDIKNK